jgi:hypothetical protein
MHSKGRIWKWVEKVHAAQRSSHFCWQFSRWLCAAFAQTAPNPPDWGAAATAVVNGIIPIVATVLPLCVGLMALFMGPRIIKSLVSRFAK